MNLENILTFSTINISHFMENDRFYEFFYIFLHSNHLFIIRITRCISTFYIFYCIHRIIFFQFFLRKTVIFHFIVIFISIKQFIIIMIFFILYFITIYLLIAVYPFFIKGIIKLVNDLSRITQFIILFIVTCVCLIVKKWRNRKNNG